MHIGDLLRVQYKGQQPNRYKSDGKPLKKKARCIIQNITNTINKDHEEEVIASQDGKKRKRHCKKYNQVGYYVPCCLKVMTKQ